MTAGGQTLKKGDFITVDGSTGQVLAGAIKLYRQHHRPGAYSFRHHTMLVHHSAKRVIHEDEAREVREVFQAGTRYQTRNGIERLPRADTSSAVALCAMRHGVASAAGEALMILPPTVASARI